jgi:hypothetical protein
MLKWYYFFTSDYKFWHDHFQRRLGSSYFELCPIEVRELQINEKGGHHFKGNNTKIEFIRKCMDENLGKTIIFSDCTLYINDKRTIELQSYIDAWCGKVDIVFCDNTINRQVNIGLMLLDCNNRTQYFWRRVSKDFRLNSWDQQLVNKNLGIIGILRHLRFPSITWSIFERSKIFCGYRFPQEFLESFFIFKQFIHPGTRKHNWNERLRHLFEAGMISTEEYDENIIPTIDSSGT